MRVSELLPEWAMTPRMRAERDLDIQERDERLEGLRVRLGELTEAEVLFEHTQGFMAAKREEMERINVAILFAKGDELLRLQGRGLATYEFLQTPLAVKKERQDIERQISEIVTAVPDAAE